MKTILIATSLMVSLSALGASTAPAGAGEKPASAGRCFYVHDVRNHTIGDDHTLYLNVRGNSVFRVGMTNSCFGASGPSDAVILKEHGSSNICLPVDLDVTLDSGGAPSRCIVDTLTRLTPAEVAALPKKVQP